MITVDYVIQHNVEDEYISDGDLAKFLLNFRKLFIGNLIPPLAVLNNVFLKTEVDDLNSNVSWKPFSISKDEFDELVSKLLSNPGLGFRLEDTPESVDCYFEWYIWAMEKAYGVPSEDHKKLELQVRDCEKRKEKAIHAKLGSNIVNALHSECVSAGMELADYLDKYIDNA